MFPMTDEFDYDVFLSYSSKDKKVVRDVADRLLKDGVKVWFDEWVLKPGDHVPSKVEEGLEHSRVLVFCMSANAFGSDWAHLESGTFRFRDPLNKKRRFIPLRLDEAPIKGSLAQFLYIDWQKGGNARAYEMLRSSCGTGENVKNADLLPSSAQTPNVEGRREKRGDQQIHFAGNGKGDLEGCQFNGAGEQAVTVKAELVARIWDVQTGRCLRALEGHVNQIFCAAWSGDQHYVITGAYDRTERVWDAQTGRCIAVLNGRLDDYRHLSIGLNRDASRAIATTYTGTRIWDIESKRCIKTIEGRDHATLSCSNLSSDGRYALLGYYWKTLIWDIESDRCVRSLEMEGGNGLVKFSEDQQFAIATGDLATELFEVDSGRRVRILRSYNNIPLRNSIWSSDYRHVISAWGSDVHLWDVESGRCLKSFRPEYFNVCGLAWEADNQRIICADAYGSVRIWDVRKTIADQ